MNRRSFSRICLGAVCLAALTAFSPAVQADPAAGNQYYELRVYSTSSTDQQKRINDFWKNAAVPAYNRMGIRPIGVFTEMDDSPTNKIYVLIPCDSMETFATIPDRLASDADYQKAGAEFLNATKSDPAYERYESSLLVAFDGMKQIAVPPEDKKPNLFELRTYMSPGDERGLNKVKMFNSGEIETMKKVGLAPVFYGRKLVGSKMPCLTYMLSGENMEEHKKHWHAFSQAPVWKELQSETRYKDNVSGIINVFLKRTDASQI